MNGQPYVITETCAAASPPACARARSGALGRTRSGEQVEHP
jgi:hypothetical protein